MSHPRFRLNRGRRNGSQQSAAEQSRQLRRARSRSCRAHEMQRLTCLTSSPWFWSRSRTGNAEQSPPPERSRAASVAAACEDGPWFGSPLAVPAGPQRVPEPRPFVRVILRVCGRGDGAPHIYCISNRPSTRVCGVSIECAVLPRVRRGRVAPPLAPARSDGQRMQCWVYPCHCEGSRHTREEWRGGGA